MPAINLEEILESEKLEQLVKESDFGYVGSVYYTETGLVIATYKNAPEAPIVLRVFKRQTAYPEKEDIPDLLAALKFNEKYIPLINPVTVVRSGLSTTLLQIAKGEINLTELDKFFTEKKKYGISLTAFAEKLKILGIRAIAYPNHQIPGEIELFEKSVIIKRLSDSSPLSLSSDELNLGVPFPPDTTEGLHPIVNPTNSARNPSNRQPRVIEYHG